MDAASWADSVMDIHPFPRVAAFDPAFVRAFDRVAGACPFVPGVGDRRVSFPLVVVAYRVVAFDLAFVLRVVPFDLDAVAYHPFDRAVVVSLLHHLLDCSLEVLHPFEVSFALAFDPVVTLGVVHQASVLVELPLVASFDPVVLLALNLVVLPLAASFALAFVLVVTLMVVLLAFDLVELPLEVSFVLELVFPFVHPVVQIVPVVAFVPLVAVA